MIRATLWSMLIGTLLWCAFGFAVFYTVHVYTDQHPRLLPLGQSPPPGVAFHLAQERRS